MHTLVALPKLIFCAMQICVLLLPSACPDATACNPADHLLVCAHLPSAVLLADDNLKHHVTSLVCCQKSE